MLKCCCLSFRPSVISFLDRIAARETARKGKQVTRCDILIYALKTYIARYEKVNGSLFILLARSVIRLDYDTVNYKYLIQRHGEKKKNYLIFLPLRLTRKLDTITGIETERQGIFISRTDLIDEAVKAYFTLRP
jgi:hypothetical protein